MSEHKTTSKTRQVYKFIEAHSKEYGVQTRCRLLGIARAGYYAWLEHPISDRAQEDARLLKLIRASFIASHDIYGAPRILQDLRERGEVCSKHRVARLMRENGLQALQGYRIRHIPVQKPSALIPNLLQRQFTVSRTTERSLGDRYYLYPHLAGLAISGRGHGSILTQDRWLGH
jgi:putative transposase